MTHKGHIFLLLLFLFFIFILWFIICCCFCCIVTPVYFDRATQALGLDDERLCCACIMPVELSAVKGPAKTEIVRVTRSQRPSHNEIIKLSVCGHSHRLSEEGSPSSANRFNAVIAIAFAAITEYKKKRKERGVHMYNMNMNMSWAISQRWWRLTVSGSAHPKPQPPPDGKVHEKHFRQNIKTESLGTVAVVRELKYIEPSKWVVEHQSMLQQWCMQWLIILSTSTLGRTIICTEYIAHSA